MALKITDFKKSLKQMNKISKAYIKYGNILVFSAFSAFLFCCLGLGRFGNYDNLLFLRGEFFTLFRDMIAAVYAPAFIIEILRLAADSDIIN